MLLKEAYPTSLDLPTQQKRVLMGQKSDFIPWTLIDWFCIMISIANQNGGIDK
ncbi:MAG: hypothetical protein GY940_30040 [bacterium]|nr:hypothetical protein [bacterium]